MLTCENHPHLRWHCKDIAVTDEGRYNHQRNIFFSGNDRDERFIDSVTGEEIKECSCPASLLIATPDTMEWLKKKRNL